MSGAVSAAMAMCAALLADRDTWRQRALDAEQIAFADEERIAWDRFAAEASYSDPHLKAEHADKMLVERRKRFGKK